MFNLTNPDGTVVARDPSNPTLGNVQIPCPSIAVAHRRRYVGHVQPGIPLPDRRQVTFAFFTDFGLTMNTEASQLRESPEGISTINSPLYGCPR